MSALVTIVVVVWLIGAAVRVANGLITIQAVEDSRLDDYADKERRQGRRHVRRALHWPLDALVWIQGAMRDE